MEYDWISSLAPDTMKKYKFHTIDSRFLSLHVFSDKATVCFPGTRDPWYKDHFHNNKLDKFDIYFMKYSESSIKKMHPLGPMAT